MRHSFLSFIIAIGGSMVLLSSCSSSKKKAFEQEAAEQNRLAPILIDTFTRFDSVRYCSTENTFHYYYTLIGNADNQEVANLKREELREQLPIEIKSAPGLTIHRKHKVIMEYIYFSERTKNELFRVKITPEEYE